MSFIPPPLFIRPTTPVTGMRAWYRTDTLTLSGTDVTQWTDKSGDARHLGLGTAPTYSSSDTNWGNRPSVSFNGVNDALGSSVASSNIVSAGAFTILIVFRPTAAGSANTSTSGLGVFTDDANWWGVTVGSSQIVINVNGGGNPTVGSAFSGLNTRMAFEGRLDSGTLYARTSGAAEASVAGANITTLTNTFSVGRSQSQVTFFAGTIQEVIVYNTALSAANRELNRQYVTGRYGIKW